MLTKEKPKNGMPQLSREAWSSLRNASMSGTSDKDLSDVYEIAETAIRKRRSEDRTWAVAHGLRNRALGVKGPVSKHVKALTNPHKNDDMSQIEAENRAVGAIQATFADESQVTKLLALQIAQRGLKSALHGDGALKAHLEPTEPAHVKIYADIAAKAVSWGGGTQVTVNCQAYAGAAIARESTEGELSIMDIE